MRARPGVLDVHDGKSRYGLRGKNTGGRGGRENGEKEHGDGRIQGSRYRTAFGDLPLQLASGLARRLRANDLRPLREAP